MKKNNQKCTKQVPTWENRQNKKVDEIQIKKHFTRRTRKIFVQGPVCQLLLVNASNIKQIDDTKCQLGGETCMEGLSHQRKVACSKNVLAGENKSVCSS